LYEIPPSSLQNTHTLIVAADLLAALPSEYFSTDFNHTASGGCRFKQLPHLHATNPPELSLMIFNIVHIPPPLCIPSSVSFYEPVILENL